MPGRIVPRPKPLPLAPANVVEYGDAGESGESNRSGSNPERRFGTECFTMSLGRRPALLLALGARTVALGETTPIASTFSSSSLPCLSESPSRGLKKLETSGLPVTTVSISKRRRTKKSSSTWRWTRVARVTKSVSLRVRRGGDLAKGEGKLRPGKCEEWDVVEDGDWAGRID